jgi:putative transposase
MRELLILAIHLLVTFAKLLRPGGVRAVAAESLLLKHQLLISNRSRQRAPNLTTLDRFVLGLTTLFVSPRRIAKLGALIKPATLFKFHNALVKRKYRLLFSSSFRRRKPGPKGPSAELIAAIIELKRPTPGSAVYASRSRSLMPSASTSTKMSCGACSRSTTGQATLEPTAPLG